MPDSQCTAPAEVAIDLDASVESVTATVPQAKDDDAISVSDKDDIEGLQDGLEPPLDIVGPETVYNTVDLCNEHILGPVADIRSLRGTIARPHRTLSVFSGTAPESLIPKTVDVLTCDCKPSSFRWIQANGPVGQHHF